MKTLFRSHSSILALALMFLGGTVVSAGAEVPDRALTPEQVAQLRTFPAIDHLAYDRSGIPTLIAGRLGWIGFGPVENSVHGYVSNQLPLFRGDGESFRMLRVDRDAAGLAHLRLQEEHNGLPIVGAEMIVHVKESTGEVTGINGRFTPTAGLPVLPGLESGAALESALREAAITLPQILEVPHLTYVLDETGSARLAWAARVAYSDEQGYQTDRIYADAINGRLVARHGLIWRARYRRIFDSLHNTFLPGQLLFEEGGSSTDVDAQKAYEHSGYAYDYFSQRHQRDSWDGTGANLVSSVHYLVNYNDAFWNGNQMVFGDGDGYDYSGFARGLDMVAHELTHGVTQAEASLALQNEPGALNEAMSDIFAASVEAFVRGLSGDTWKFGEDIKTPGIYGDAIRYMDNPTLDGYSRDYYPERYTGSADSGGIHWNSGIANLAFYLLSQGGSHPRGKTSIVVPAIGMLDAEWIFYRTLSAHYMISTTNFQGARDATLQAASDLSGICGSHYNAVQKAWDAVGVPVSDGHELEPNDDPSQANPLQLYSSYTVGYLCTAGGSDWFSIEKPSSSNVLSIDLYPPASRDYDLELWQGGPVSTSYNTGSGVSEHISWPYGTGTFYIRVVGKNGAYSQSSSYQLSVSQ